MELETLSQIYSIVTKIIALSLILVVTPVMLKQLSVRRLYHIKLAFIALAITAFVCILPVLMYQIQALFGTPPTWLFPYATIANSTSLLVTAGAMFVIYKTGE